MSEEFWNEENRKNELRKKEHNNSGFSIEDVTAICYQIHANDLGHHGGFLHYICHAFSVADFENKKLLFDVMVKIIKKYNLDKEYEYDGISR